MKERVRCSRCSILAVYIFPLYFSRALRWSILKSGRVSKTEKIPDFKDFYLKAKARLSYMCRVFTRAVRTLRATPSSARSWHQIVSPDRQRESYKGPPARSRMVIQIIYLRCWLGMKAMSCRGRRGAYPARGVITRTA